MGAPITGEDQFATPVEATIFGVITVAAVPNRAAWTAQTVTVAVPGTAVQGPNVPVPDGFSVAIVFRTTQLGNPQGYMGNSMANASNPSFNTQFLKGDTRRLFITNMDLLWFDSDTAGAVFELFVEQ